MLATISVVIACVGGIGLIAGLVYAATLGHGDREAEEAARAFLTEHGHWPDEPPPQTPRPRG